MRFYTYLLIFVLSESSLVFGLDTLSVQYNQDVETYFSSSIQRALAQGVITPDLKKKQNGIVLFNGKQFPVKLRLKGDWTDHISENRWSMRVEMKEGNIYNLREFSLQDPKTRGGNKEALFHRIIQDEGILTTAYTFIILIVNGENWGEYAIESHPDEHLLENQGRSNGPIVKFDETGFWEVQSLMKTKEENYDYELYSFQAAEIQPFHKKRIKKDSVQSNMFQIAQSTLKQGQLGFFDESDLDIERFAKYYAVCDVFSMYHGLQWHNQRFYYRPQDGKLEPLAYDCFDDDNSLIGKPFLGFFDDHYDTVYFAEQWFNYQLFNIEEFKEAYWSQLEIYLGSDYFKKYVKSDFVYDDFYQELSTRRIALLSHKKEDQAIPHFYSYESWKRDNPDKLKAYAHQFDKKPLKHVSINAQASDSTTVKNFHLYPLNILGFGDKKEIKQIISIPLEPQQEFTFARTDWNRIYVETDSKDTLKYKVISVRPLVRDSQLFLTDYFDEMSPGIFSCKSRNIEIDGLLVLPAKSTFNIESSNIDFVKGGKLICYGECKIVNSRIFSSDQAGFGLAFIENKITIENTVIENFKLNSLDGNSPVLAFNCEVKIENCGIKNIQSLDAINLVNSIITIENVQIANCSGDGLDLDYCSGKINNMIIANCDGDGIDFSGSKVNVEAVNIDHCKDKGISVGERSEIKLSNAQLARCNSGIAVKDASVLRCNMIQFTYCVTDIHAFRKKNFYIDGGTIISESNGQWNINLDSYSHIFHKN